MHINVIRIHTPIGTTIAITITAAEVVVLQSVVEQSPLLKHLPLEQYIDEPHLIREQSPE